MKSTLTRLAVVVALIVVMPTSVAVAELLRNPGFEITPILETGQGLLPSDYVTAAATDPGADTYSNDGSYGLEPSDFGNFPDMTAQEGIRWVAGAYLPAAPPEAIGQSLSTPLVPGVTYHFNAFLIESPRFHEHGGYELLLSPAADFSDPGAVSLGRLSPTTGPSQWEKRSLSFVAPSMAESLSFFILTPYSDSANLAYIGIDNMSFTPSTPGDFDNDGDVDGDDFLIWQASFGVNNGGDADGDEDTDGDDFLIWQSNFGSVSGSVSEAAPESASIVLLIAAFVGSAFVKRR